MNLDLRCWEKHLDEGASTIAGGAKDSVGYYSLSVVTSGIEVYLYSWLKG